ncbi:MAG: response regulator [Methylomonas sp.]|uniref:response regulator n=1 Tax=Methylomonas sp. TaxID=418 RepID=UPI0025CF4D84|nr:response regulator [Methylomonas sp.]MCK9605044.1 response regulator [Methylomonas sp.]
MSLVSGRITHQVFSFKLFKRPQQVKDFLLLFIPIAILVVVGTWTLADSCISAELSMLMAEEKTYVELSQGRLDQELAIPIRHLASLVNEMPVRRIYETVDVTDLGLMEEAFISLMSRNPNYDQVRWIDQLGRERVRVNNKSGQQYLVPETQLKDKHERYFFVDTMRLEKGVIFISPLDLNVDNAQVEMPYKPTIRIATRVFDKTGNPRGILIINIAARSMLNAVVSSVGPAANRLMLINANGYWLKSPDQADEWAFMFQRKVNMENRYPDAWMAISKTVKGQIRLPDGLWTWNSVSPVPGTDSRLAHNIRWKAITHLPEQDLIALEYQVWPTKIAYAIIALLLFGVGIDRLVQAKSARAQAEKDAALARSEAESAHRIRDAQASFKMLFEANTSGLLVVDALGRIVMANPAFEGMFGYPLSELLHQSVEMLLPETIRTQHAQQREAYLRTPTNRAMGANRELYGTHKDGSVFPIEIGLSPYQDNGQPFVLATIVDISERKHIQDEIVRMKEILEQRVAERTTELQAARQEAERLASVKGNFLANMSHEIRTPMNAILGLAYLLEKAHLGPEELTLVKKIRIAGRSLLGIINDILDFSKIESGRLEIEHAPFRLNDVLDNVATLMSAVEYKDEVELSMGPAPEGMEFLRGDALRVEQILVNLISNALKFTERGSVTLTITRLPANDERDYLRFSVLDTGKGIVADKQVEIFTPFVQEDTSTTRCFGGTGLGLSICGHLVKMMGGEIGVISEPGKGSEFWFVLPVELVEPRDYVQPAMAFQNVLIADDHPVAREMLAATVRSLGWTPEVVSSGEEAIQRVIARARNNKIPDLLLLDWRMPGMDGLTAGRQIKKALGDIPNAPLIVMATAHDRETLMHKADSNVVDAILNKPVTASALYNAVSEAKRQQQGGHVGDSSVMASSDSRLHQLRVLVVDDSEINRDMARRILELESAVVYLADDGQVAVEWLSKNSERIDVVLMDIQMPVMDGYEATRQIRETLGLSSLPIIALTAGAFKNQQTAALVAGMNGFIAKPFDVDELITMLQYYLSNKPEENTKPKPAEIAVATETIENPTIDLARGLRGWGDAATYHRYLRMFADTHAHDGDEIGALIARDAPEKARALAHKLKGTAGNMAIMVVWELAEKIEQMLDEGTEAGDWPQKLQLALNNALAMINELTRTDISTDDEAISREIDKNIIGQILHDLLRALDQDNPDEAEPSLCALDKALPAQLLRPIREMLDNFDFRAAEKQTKALIDQLNINPEEV